MHCYNIQMPEGSDLEAWINHNSDWTGDAYLCVDKCISPHQIKPLIRITIPGKVFECLIKQTNEYAIDAIKGVLDTLRKGGCAP